MNLHLKIKECVDKKGAEIIVTNTLIGMLDDEQVFEDIESAPYKKILRNLIKEGYAQKLLDLGSYTSDVNYLASQYAQTNLMQESFVLYVLECLAYGLGWMNKEPILQENTQTSSGPTSIPQEKKETRGFFHRLFIFILWLISGVLFGASIPFVANFLKDNQLLLFLYMFAVFGIPFYITYKTKIKNISWGLYIVIGGLGIIGGCTGEEYYEDLNKKTRDAEINRMITKGDTLALSNFINKSSDYSTLEDYEKNTINDKYDSLKYVMMGCDKIVYDMLAHTKVLKSYGFSDTSQKKLYSENFYIVLSSLMKYKNDVGNRSLVEYMVSKLIPYLYYDGYPWKDIKYNNWKRFEFVDSNNVLIKCPSINTDSHYIPDFQIWLTKEKGVWCVDDYIEEDLLSLDNSLKETYKTELANITSYEAYFKETKDAIDAAERKANDELMQWMQESGYSGPSRQTNE